LKIGHTWIGRTFHKTGLNQNCKFLLFEFVFDQLKMNRIGFGASAENINRIKAMEGVGCQYEGKLRNFLPTVDGHGRTDIVLMSIIKADWQTKVKEALSNKIKPRT